MEAKMPKRTILYRQHVQAGAQIVDFCGWEMPLHYGSQLEEHHHVRSSVGMFDVSHMGVVDITGSDAFYFLRFLLSNDIQKLSESGRALYTCMLNHEGGILDDLIVYRIADEDYRLIVNAGSFDKIMAWLTEQAERYVIDIHPRDDLAMVAVQGPDAIHRVRDVLDIDEVSEKLKNLKPFRFLHHDEMFIARTGYTGESGVEIILPESKAVALWKDLLKARVKPCGLGARDTLRLEAGFNLYGGDMDETTTPLESNLAWTVSWNDAEREFIGKSALKKQLEQGVKRQLVGLCMPTRGMMRSHQKVFCNENSIGEITSGGFSPILGHSIALARIPVGDFTSASIDYRGKKIPVNVIKPPFVKQGQKAF
jgi:aminomethyltransferase